MLWKIDTKRRNCPLKNKILRNEYEHCKNFLAQENKASKALENSSKKKKKKKKKKISSQDGSQRQELLRLHFKSMSKKNLFLNKKSNVPENKEGSKTKTLFHFIGVLRCPNPCFGHALANVILIGNEFIETIIKIPK